jgi:hypothetical protein
MINQASPAISSPNGTTLPGPPVANAIVAPGARIPRMRRREETVAA